MTDKETKMNRRAFLKGTALVAVGVAGSTLESKTQAFSKLTGEDEKRRNVEFIESLNDEKKSRAVRKMTVAALEAQTFDFEAPGLGLTGEALHVFKDRVGLVREVRVFSFFPFTGHEAVDAELSDRNPWNPRLEEWGFDIEGATDLKRPWDSDTPPRRPWDSYTSQKMDINITGQFKLDGMVPTPNEIFGINIREWEDGEVKFNTWFGPRYLGEEYIGRNRTFKFTDFYVKAGLSEKGYDRYLLFIPKEDLKNAYVLELPKEKEARFELAMSPENNMVVKQKRGKNLGEVFEISPSSRELQNVGE